MAVKYVKEFSFPSEYGFHKPSSQAAVKGVAKGMGSFHKSKAGPSVVTGSSAGKGGGKLQTGSVPKFARGGSTTPYCYAKGGSADIKSGVGKGGDVRNKGAGTGYSGEHIKMMSDLQRERGSRTEKSSGVQKPAFAKGGHWIKGAIKHPGALHKEMGVPAGKKIPAKALAKAATKGGKLGQRARLAETLKGMHKSEGGTAKCYAKGGRVADAPVPMGEKKSWNKDDAVSPGSPKRTPVKQSEKNKPAASSKFAAEGRGTEPATKQSGDVERMSGFSDFKKGGSAHPLKNLGHYAHGGKVKATRSEVSSGKADDGVVNRSPPESAGEYESEAGTSKKDPGDYYETASGTASMAMGGLSRGTSRRKNAAIHAKAHKGGTKGAGIGALAQALSGAGAPQQGIGAPPGMNPGMGAPPGGPMGGMAPQAPVMGGGPPAMADGGVLHVVHHHVNHQ